MFGLKSKAPPARAEAAGARALLLQSAADADAAAGALAVALAHRRAALQTLAAYSPSSGQSMRLKRAMHRSAVDRALAAAGVSQHASIEHSGAAARRSLTDQARAVLGREAEE